MRVPHVAAAALALSLSATPVVAHAKSSADTAEVSKPLPEIEETGITAFDSVFTKVKAIHDTLAGAQSKLEAARDEIAASVGLPAGTPVRMSMWELKQKAGGKVQVQIQNGKPKVIAGTGDVQSSANAVNRAVGSVGSTIAELGKLPKQVQELVEACKSLPAQLNPQLLQEAGLSPLQLPKVAKSLGKNVKATAATPKRIATLVSEAQGMLTGIPQGLAATEPPSEGGKTAKAKKKSKGGSGEELPTNTPTGEAIAEALAAFEEAEVDKAAQILDRAEDQLNTLRSALTPVELTTLYQTRALVHLVAGETGDASAATTRALVVDPKVKPLPTLGPDYRKLHKSLQKSGAIRTVEVQVTGSGTARISGQQVTGGNALQVAEGVHLVQIEDGDRWRSEVVRVREGWVLEL